jgi:hypothetical protein
MVCKAEGSPQPWVEWRKDNQQVVDAFGHSEGVLVLRGVNRTDGGLYTCVAQNTFGTDMHSIQVVVRCKYLGCIYIPDTCRHKIIT